LAIETRSFPDSLGATLPAFTFYLADPSARLRAIVATRNQAIETRSAPALTHVLPRIRSAGFPIYVTRRPTAPFARCFPRSFTFYLADPSGSIETRSFPNSLGATLRAFTFYLADPSARLRSCNGCEATARLFIAPTSQSHSAQNKSALPGSSGRAL
jgi:hypothetical protein